MLRNYNLVEGRVGQIGTFAKFKGNTRMNTYFDKQPAMTGAIASAFKPRPPGFLIIAILAAITAIILATASTSVAQTPDGETPAQEAVCDVLHANGTTKGLYGLCVAFCEAHDAADENTAITEADIEEMLMSAPHGRILKNYNKKKTDTDPDMPCIKVQEPCPCWTQEHADAIDGVLSDGSTGNLVSKGLPFSVIQEFGRSPGFEGRSVLAYENFRGAEGVCQVIFQSLNTSPITNEVVTLWYYSAGDPNNSLTAQEFEACRTSVVEVQTRNGF